MSAHPLRNPLLGAVLALGLAALAAPRGAAAQLREVVSKEVAVGSSEATLRLGLSGNRQLEVRFQDGSVVIDGTAVGAYEPGGELDAHWRELLGRAVALEDGPLAEFLFAWAPPEGLSGALGRTAQAIDEALESALETAAPTSSAQVDAAAPDGSQLAGDAGALVRTLLDSPDRLRLLGDALAGLDLDHGLRVHLDEDVRVAEDEVVEGTLVVLGGRASVAGEIEGDVVVVDGSLELLEGATVSGGVRLADSRLVRNRGEVGGRIIDVEDDARLLEREMRAQLRNEIRRELRDELRPRDDDGFSLFSPIRSVARGVGGALQNLVALLVLGLIGAGVLALGGPQLDVIAETARRQPARAAMVGLAGTFLLVPVWVLGLVALLVSIVGIPIAVAWLPLFPLAAVLAAVVGYLAVARNAGEWLAESDLPWTHWIRKSNPLMTMVGGLLGLAFLFIAANLLSILPVLGALRGLLTAVGLLITFAAVQIGFGAVLLTRAGKRRNGWSRYSADEAWEAALRVNVEDAGEGASAGRREDRPNA